MGCRWLAAFLKARFSSSLYITVTWALAVELFSGECHRTSLIRKASTWAKVDPDLSDHMASLGHSQLLWTLRSHWLTGLRQHHIAETRHRKNMERLNRHNKNLSSFPYTVHNDHIQQCSYPLLMHANDNNTIPYVQYGRLLAHKRFHDDLNTICSRWWV